MAGHVSYSFSLSLPPSVLVYVDELFLAPGIDNSTKKMMLRGEGKRDRHKKKRMKTKQVAHEDQFSAMDLEVSQILLLLSVPLVNAKSFACPIAVGWGTKRKRSDSGSNPPLLSLQSVAPGSGVSEPKCGFVSPPPATDKVAAMSPATPLAFLPSEPEENPKPLKRKSSVKKKKKKLGEFIDGLSEERISLNVELEDARNYYGKPKAFDMELKAIKRRIDVELDKGKTESEFASLKPESSPVRVETRDYLHSMMQDQTVHTQRSDINDQAVHNPSSETSSPSPPTCVFGAIDLKFGPLTIHDLNISVDHSQSPGSSPPLDLSLSLGSQGKQERNWLTE